jgi:hypothetical protein
MSLDSITEIASNTTKSQSHNPHVISEISSV